MGSTERHLPSFSDFNCHWTWHHISRCQIFGCWCIPLHEALTLKKTNTSCEKEVIFQLNYPVHKRKDGKQDLPCKELFQFSNCLLVVMTIQYQLCGQATNMASFLYHICLSFLVLKNAFCGERKQLTVELSFSTIPHCWSNNPLLHGFLQ